MSSYGYSQPYNAYGYAAQPTAPPPPPPLPPRPPTLSADPAASLAQQLSSLGISPQPPATQPQYQYQQQANVPVAPSPQPTAHQHPPQPAYSQQQSYQSHHHQGYQQPPAPPPHIQHPPPAPAAYPSYTAPAAPQATGVQLAPPPAQPAYQYSQPPPPPVQYSQPPPSQYSQPPPPAPSQPPAQAHYQAPPAPSPAPPAPSPAPPSQYLSPRPQYLPGTQQYNPPVAPQQPYHSPPAQPYHQPTQFLAPTSPAPPSGYAATQYGAPAPQYHAPSPVHLASSPATSPLLTAATPAPAAYQLPSTAYQAPLQAAPPAPPVQHQAPAPASSAQYQAQAAPSQPHAPPYAHRQSVPVHAAPAPAQHPPQQHNLYAAFATSPPAQSSSGAAWPTAQQSPAGSTPLPNLEDDPLPPLALIRPEGNPLPILPTCPGNREMLFTTTFYHLPAHPDFRMCSFCHAKHVANTSLAPAFVGAATLEGSCSFGMSLRLSKVLLLRRDLDAITDFVALRAGIPKCTGSQQSAGTEYWTSPEFSNMFSVCNGCYHDWLGATPWQSKFTKQSGDPWYCDGSQVLQQRGLARYGSRGDWAGFVAYINRYPLEVCEGKPVPANSTRWYTPRRTIEGMVVCQSCYHDQFVGTPFGNEMVPYTPPIGDNEFTCDLHHATLTNAMSMAVCLTGNYNTFWNTAAAHLATMIKGQNTFYTLAGPPSNFDVCETCLLGYFVPLGMQGYFRQQTNPSTCDMCPDAPRRGSYHYRLMDAYFQANFRAFGAFARSLSQHPACPKRDVLKKGTWYSLSPTCNICPHCWITFASGTPLGRAVNVQPAQKPQSLICCLMSPRMRRLWLAGNLDDFKAFAAHREGVYVKTWLKFKQDLQMDVMKAAMAGNTGVNGLLLAGSYADPGSTVYGNSSIGWYDSSAQATGHQMIQQSNQMWSQVGKGHMDHAALVQIWSSVE